MACALEPVDGEEVYAELYRALGVFDGGALVQDDDAGCFELLDDRTGRVSCGFHNIDALVDNGLGVRGVVGGNHGGEEGEVNGERVLGEGATSLDLGAQGGGGGEDEGGDDTQTAGVGDGRGEVGCAYVHHSTLDNRHCASSG